MDVTVTGNPVFAEKDKGLHPIHLSDIVAALSSDLKLDKTLTKYLSKRTRFEGIKFLCQILPKFCGAVLKSLELGGAQALLKDKIICHVRIKRRSPFRVLIEGLYHEDGKPRVDDHAKYSLYCILQICEFFKKLELPSETKTQYQGALNFVEKNKSMGQTSPPTVHEIRAARHIIQRVFPMDYKSSEHFYHAGSISDGPGTYSQQLPVRNRDGHKQPCQTLKRGKVNNVFPEAARRYKKFILDSYPEGAVFEDIPLSCSELLLVPKTYDKVRAIVREPKHNLRMQSPFFDEQSRFLNEASNGRLNIYSQDDNRRRAYEGSIDRKTVTADIENGSNSVSFTDIYAYERTNSPIRNLLDHCRTSQVFVPLNWEQSKDSSIASAFKTILIEELGTKWFLGLDGVCEQHIRRNLQRNTREEWFINHNGHYKHIGSAKSVEKCIGNLFLHKRLISELEPVGIKIVYNNRLGYLCDLNMLAGMGSYLTFCFMMRHLMTTLILSAIQSKFGSFQIALEKVRRTQLNAVIDKVFTSTNIYGDDMEYLPEYHDAFIGFAASKGIIINQSKTFIHSHFRESCGPYFYNGADVTPVRCKLKAIDEGSAFLIENENTNLISLADLTCRLRDSGLNHLSKVFKKNLRRHVSNTKCVGVLSNGDAVGYDIGWSSKRSPYFGLTDDDRYAIYNNSEVYRPTDLGLSVLRSTEKLSSVTRSSLKENWLRCPALFQYEPFGSPSIGKGDFVLKGDVYEDVNFDSLAEWYQEAWSYVLLAYLLVVYITICSIVAGASSYLLFS